MRRLLALLPVLLLGPAPATAAAARPFATAEMTTCRPALEQADRLLVTEGEMRTLPGAASMRMRFDLQVRSDERPRWTPVQGENLGVWNTARPAPRRFTYAKRIVALWAPAAYRMVVRFRWLRGDGRRLAVARRVSAVCRQRDLRPDLTPLQLTTVPSGDPATRRYVVGVRNTGRSGAGAFVVGLSIGGVEQPSQAVPALAAGERRSLEFTAPPCVGESTVIVRLDLEGAVQEVTESDNRIVWGCPSLPAVVDWRAS